MSNFDYKTAWAEVAYPEYLNLPENIKSLVCDTLVMAGELHQDSKLLMPWSDELLSRFEEIPSEQLAIASHVVYCWGHWSTNTWPHDRGVYWKFSNYADQVLRSRCGLPRNGSDHSRPGTHFEIHQGFLRVCASASWMWTWREIALGTPETLSKARSMPSNIAGWAGRRDFEERVDSYFKELTALRLEVPESIRRFFNIVELYPED